MILSVIRPWHVGVNVPRMIALATAMRRLQVMRTRITVTLDADVADGIEREMRRTARTIDEVVSDALRAGLQPGGTVTVAPFTVDATDLGLRPAYEIDGIATLLERIEDGSPG